LGEGETIINNLSTFRGRPTATPAASWVGHLRSRIEELFCSWLTRRGFPGAIQPMTFTDELTRQTVTVRVTTGYTILTVDGRDFFFHRLTGTFDGTGGILST